MVQLQVLKSGYCWYFAGQYESDEEAHRAARLFHRDDPIYAIYPAELAETSEDRQATSFAKRYKPLRAA